MKIFFIAAAVGLLFGFGCSAQFDSSCVMNGFGDGHCTITNLSSIIPSSTCFKVEVCHASSHGSRTCNIDATISSTIVCSGSIGYKETKEVPFTVVGIGEYCNGYDIFKGESWIDVCNFYSDEVN